MVIFHQGKKRLKKKFSYSQHISLYESRQVVLEFHENI